MLQSSGTDPYYGASPAIWRAAATAVVALNNRRTELLLESLHAKAATDRLRLAAADRALDDGEVQVACLIYTRLALSHRQDQVTEKARQRIWKLREQAHRELSSIDTKLTSGEPDQIRKAFHEYDLLVRKYRHLGRVGGESGEIARQVARRRRDYSSELEEAEAASLCELGRHYEEQGHLCCAFLLYEEAAKRSSAPSAQFAEKRFTKMSQNPRIVASAETCRDVQWCLENFFRAEQHLAEGKRELARTEFRQISQRAPEDSEVYRAASDQLAVIGEGEPGEFRNLETGRDLEEFARKLDNENDQAEGLSEPHGPVVSKPDQTNPEQRNEIGEHDTQALFADIRELYWWIRPPETQAMLDPKFARGIESAIGAILGVIESKPMSISKLKAASHPRNAPAVLHLSLLAEQDGLYGKYVISGEITIRRSESTEIKVWEHQQELGRFLIRASRVVRSAQLKTIRPELKRFFQRLVDDYRGASVSRVGKR